VKPLAKDRTPPKPPSKTTAPKTVAEYLAAAPRDKRVALMGLRKTIKAAAPKATESLSYGLVGFKYNGEALVYFGYARSHCALYGSTGRFVREHASELKAYDLSTGTIRFQPAKPLPARLVTKMVKARVAEIDRTG